VFFYDILVYSKNITEHIQHLKEVLQTLHMHSLFAKISKCYFVVSEVEYLGHIINAQGVYTDSNKVVAMVSWLLPRTLKQLRGFLGLARYYRRFFRGYGIIAKPLTDMLKKDNFIWCERVEQAFHDLKKRMSCTPVLALPDFSKVFVVEVDAFGQGVGAVLMQDHHPIAFISRIFNLQQQAYSTYEKELVGVVFVVQKW